MSSLMDYHDGSWGAGEWLAMGTMMLLFWAVVIGLVVWAARSRRSTGPSDQTSSATPTGPNTLLAERYARGEIDEVEYLRRRDLLQSAAVSPSVGRRTR